MMRFTHAMFIAAALLAAGCSSNDSRELPPAELKDFQAELKLSEQWSRSIGAGQGDAWNQLELASEGESLFAADVEGLVVAMQRSTGEVLWKKDLDLPVSGGVGAGYGLVLVGTLRGDVIALDSQSGEQKWRAHVGGEVLSAPGSNGDVVVVQTQDDRIIGLNASTGSQLWSLANNPAVLSLRGTSAPVVTNRLAVAALSTGKVIAVDVQRGIPVWEQRVAVPKGRSELDRLIDIDGGLLLSGDTLYVVTYQGSLAAMELQSGRILWQRQASSYVGVAAGFGSVYLSQDSGSVEGIDERSTSALWSNTDLARRQLTTPATLSSNVVVADFEGYVHVLSQVDGRFMGRVRVDSEGVRARPLVINDWLYVYGNSGTLEAYSIE